MLIGNHNETPERRSSIMSTKRQSLVELGPMPIKKKFIKQLPPSVLDTKRVS